MGPRDVDNGEGLHAAVSPPLTTALGVSPARWSTSRARRMGATPGEGLTCRQASSCGGPYLALGLLPALRADEKGGVVRLFGRFPGFPDRENARPASPDRVRRANRRRRLQERPSRLGRRVSQDRATSCWDAGSSGARVGAGVPASPVNDLAAVAEEPAAARDRHPPAAGATRGRLLLPTAVAIRLLVRAGSCDRERGRGFCGAAYSRGVPTPPGRPAAPHRAFNPPPDGLSRA